MLADKLVEKDIFLESISYIKNTRITEYDLKSAGFNIIREYKLVNEETKKILESLPKQERTIEIGKLMKQNPQLNIELTKKFADVRKLFVIENNIQEEDVLSVKKDAIFIINRTLSKLKFGKYLEFQPKNIYTSYLYINGMEFYYSSYTKQLDIKNFKRDFNAESLVLKGGEDTIIELDDHLLIKDLKHLIALSEKISQKELFNSLKRYRKKYLNRELPLETYREVKSGLFTLSGSDIALKFIEEDLRKEINIFRNYVDFLVPFCTVLL